jgi:outer membrane protein TolC
MNKKIADQRFIAGISAFIFLSAFLSARVCGEEPAAGSTPRLITISEGIAMVLKDSRLIKIARAEKDMALEDSFLARSALLPHVNASVTQVFLNHQPMAKFGPQVTPTAEKNSLSYGFDVYQTLFDFGKSLSLFKAARESVNAGGANLDAVRKIAVLEFVTGYFDLLEAQKLIEVAQKEVESLSSYLRDIEHLYEVGAAVKNDLLPAQVKLADTKQRLIASRNFREARAMRLNTILALPVREKIAVQDVEADSLSMPPMENAWETAQWQRPEIALIRDQIKASSLIERAKALENFPELFVDGGYSYSRNKFVVHQDNMFLNLGAKASVFEGGAERSQLNSERAHRRELALQRDKLMEDIQFEIEDSYLGLKDATEKVAVAKDSLAQAEENVRVNRVKFTEGSATTTDVLEAISLQTGAQTNYYNSVYEMKRNYAKLMYSMGIDLALVYDRMDHKRDESKQP